MTTIWEIGRSRLLRRFIGIAVLALGFAHGALAQTPAPQEPSAVGAQADSALQPGTVGPDGRPQLDHDLSVWGMFVAAGSVVKVVMILLVLASIWNVMVFFEKSFVMRRVNRQADRFLQSFRAAPSLETLGRGAMNAGAGPMARMFTAGVQELSLSAQHGGLSDELRERVRERVGYTMGIVQAHETRNLGSSMSLLATIGSTAPFIGLFGTVWGIMTSFIGIAQTQTTNLAVVAPGIAEALLATAIGLVAAIPAVMLYNKFSRDIGTFAGRLEDFAAEFAVVMSRELDRREVA